MWISKKKLEKLNREQYVKAMQEEMRISSELEQEKRLEKLEKQVKKLEKWVKNGY